MSFSIVIPVYNVAEYLRGCVDSVLANDLADCEIILVDDGSTDGICPGICDEYGAAFPDLIRVIHQQNKGLGGARNTGLEAAVKEYLFFVDSDDTIPANAIAVLRSEVEKTGADIVSFPLYSHDGAGNGRVIQTSGQYPGPFTLREHPEFLLGLPSAWSRVWRRKLFLDSGVRYPSRVLYEDIRTSGKLFAIADSIVTIDQPLYEYLARPGSIMRSTNLERNREILAAFDDLLGWFGAHDMLETYYDQLCRLAIDHVLLAATVRVARLDPKSGLLAEFTGYMDEHFLDYRNNPYIGQLPGLHKLLLKLIRWKQYGLIRLLFRLKGD